MSEAVRRGLARWGLIAIVTALVVSLTSGDVRGNAQPRPNPIQRTRRANPAAIAPRLTLVPPSPVDIELRHQVGEEDNRFFRARTPEGLVAAHVVAASGQRASVVTAFHDQGNSGAGLWFEGRPNLQILGEVGAAQSQPGLRGVAVDVEADVGDLTVDRAALGSTRALRHADLKEEIPEEIREIRVAPQGSSILPSRETLDQYLVTLRIDPLEGTRVERGPDGRIRLLSSGGRVRFRVTSRSNYEPLTLNGNIFKPGAHVGGTEWDTLAVLGAYRDKLLAGSWQYLTYFGRDTLMSIRLLMHVLQPDAIEAGIGSVLQRLSRKGEVAHEEIVGEYAALEHSRLGRTSVEQMRKPIYDYRMVDDDFMLAPVIAHYLLDTPEGRARAKTFLATRVSPNETYAERLLKNLKFVLERARAYAENQDWRNLISLKHGLDFGTWRDSNNGLAKGRFPYDVNVALVPAALEATQRLLEAGADIGLSSAPEQAARAGEYARAWASAGRWFNVTVSGIGARRSRESFWKARGLASMEIPGLRELDGKDFSFPALALRKDGTPISIMHSDVGFTLLFTNPSPASLRQTAAVVRQLLFKTGMHIAELSFVGPNLSRMFTPDDYHGTVDWPWQESLMRAGLLRQLARTDLDAQTRTDLQRTYAQLLTVVAANAGERGSEVRSFAVENGRMVHRPYGQNPPPGVYPNRSNGWQGWNATVDTYGDEGLQVAAGHH